MSKKYLLLITIIIIFSIAIGVFLLSESKIASVPKKELPEFDIPAINTDELEKKKEEQKINNLLNSLTLEEKIGQMLIIEYRYPNVDEKLTNYLNTLKPGGFILFKENLQEYNSSLNFIESINSLSNIPMFMGIDEEGGRVDRIENTLNYPYEKIPPMSEIGATNDENIAYNTGVKIAEILKDFNINMDFAPVIDVYSNINNTVIGNRSFGSNPYLVAKMGIALQNGLKDNNIIPIYKHFPGHGDTATDSHYDLPVITKTKEELKELELIPFMEAINKGADVIMIGHLAIPSITNDNTPASLSKTLITDLLKNELGYQNLVITDALNMQAITKNYSDKEVYELAINAGVDLLLMPNNKDNVIDLIKELIAENKITEEQINSSVTKILTLKSKYGLI